MLEQSSACSRFWSLGGGRHLWVPSSPVAPFRREVLLSSMRDRNHGGWACILTGGSGCWEGSHGVIDHRALPIANIPTGLS